MDSSGSLGSKRARERPMKAYNYSALGIGFTAGDTNHTWCQMLALKRELERTAFQTEITAVSRANKSKNGKDASRGTGVW
jgi:hypothetical protein